MNARIFSVPLVASILAATPAGAATLSGTISDVKASPIKGIEVRLWGLSTKTKVYDVVKKASTDASGKYKFTGIAAGDFKLDARMPAMMLANYGDRWYDQAQPVSKGYISSDADVITVKATDTLTGYNITLEATGGLDATVASKSGLAAGIQVRCEQKTEHRIHHSDFSMPTFTYNKATVTVHLGKSYFRGLLPSDYRLLFHGPDGKYETQVAAGPYKVASTKTAKATKVTLVAMALDPYEPNNSPSDKGSAINKDLFHLTTPQPFVTSGALIGPRNSGDVDWYCYDALATDRYIITADMPLKVEGKVREHPWVDPVVGLFAVPAKSGVPAKVKTDDDGGPGLRDAKLDSGVLGTKGRYCVAVTTFGDTAWLGKTQNSAGRYRLTITMGNRQPLLTVTHLGATYQGKTAPVIPTVLNVKEGAKLKFDLDFSDIDGDTLTASMKLVDSASKAVTGGAFKTDTGVPIPAAGGTFKNGKGRASFTWEAGETAASTSPFGLTFDIKDAEYTMRTSFTIKVDAVNHPPTTPKLKEPSHKSTVSTATPNLAIYNSTDVDGDTLSYDLEIYYKQAGGAKPDESKTAVAQGTNFTFYKVINKMPENTWIFWRARANDGNPSANYSPWTQYFAFLVNTTNEAPSTPNLIKPANNETVLNQQPTLSASNPADPEKDPITLRFQVAKDANFAIGLLESPDVAMNTAGKTTMWTVSSLLDWGGTYYARVYAKDKLGAQSGYSYVHKFMVKTNTTKPDTGPTPDMGVPDQGGVKADRGPDTGGGGGTSDGTEDEGGCACDLAGERGTGVVWLLVLGLALALVWRRRRR